MQYMQYISTEFKNIDIIFESCVVLEAIRRIYADYVSHDIVKDNSREETLSDREKVSEFFGR